MKLNYSSVLVAVTAAVLLISSSAGASEVDGRVASSAKESYVFKTYLKDDNINITSKDGAVTLTGTVADESHKSLAQETVASLPGVVSVENQLEYDGDEKSAEGSDSWISMQVKYSLLYNRHVSGINTQVFVTDGVVTLKGEAENQAQKELAGQYAKDIEGVQEVKNEMTIAQIPGEPKRTMGDKIDDASITAQVKTALLFHRSTSAFKTDVSTTNGIVTLSGKATSDAGKALAGKVASDVNGVLRVINNMTIVKTLQ